jgi:alpha-galactosidase
MRQKDVQVAFTSLTLVVALVNHAKALENGCGRLPPMGYNTWNDFGCKNLTSASIGLVADR